MSLCEGLKLAIRARWVAGAVLALGLFLFWVRPIRLVDSILILLVAYIAKHAALAQRRWLLNGSIGALAAGALCLWQILSW